MAETDPSQDDDSLARLLRYAQPASLPPEDVTQRTHEAVRTAWQRIQARRALQRRRFALAATVVLALAGSWLVYGLRAPVEVASVAALRGTLQLQHDGGAITALVAGRSLSPGDRVRAGKDASLLLRRPGGATLRLAANSELIVRDADRVELLRGSAYLDIDAKDGARERLTVLTSAGELRHLGTRFAVVVQPGLVRFAVREGRVELAQSGERTTLDAGEQAQVGSDGQVQRQALQRASSVWDWTDVAASRQVQIDDRALYAVLQELGIALDLPVRYASPQLEAQARTTQLHGAPLTLPAAVALDGVLLATDLQARTGAEAIEIMAR